MNKTISKGLIYVYVEEMNGSKKGFLYKTTQKGKEILNQSILDIIILFEATLHEVEKENDRNLRYLKSYSRVRLYIKILK